MTASSIPIVLRERASLQPNDTAFTFVDYDADWNGVEHSLTWAQLYRRTLNMAEEITAHAAVGDRAVVIAPQGLDYLVAFLGALQAGVVAVPLSVPFAGQHDERVSAVLADATPTVILTTSALTDVLAEYTNRPQAGAAPTVIAVDLLDLEIRQKTTSGKLRRPDVAYLQYTSGSTRTPAGVIVTHDNLSANFEQQVDAYFSDHGGVAPMGTVVVSWLPFYHDMGLLLGVVAPILGGWKTVFTTPLAFLARPARWMQLLAAHPKSLTAGPNFAFELAVGRTADADMAGLDLGAVQAIISGSERVHDATLKRFANRFGRFNLKPEALRPSYGLAEAVLYVATERAGQAPKVVSFEPEKLSAGRAEESDGTGTPLVGYGTPKSPSVRIVDPETRVECPANTVGEIWVRGANVCDGYWEKPELTETVFRATISDPTEGTDAGPWLKTGDLGFLSDGELFIVGRIKDLLIVRGVNHYPDDIEATIQEISGGRVAAISVEKDRTEQLVAIVEVRADPNGDEDFREKLTALKSRLTAAISQVHALNPADIVLVGRGAIPITTSGKVRRASCAQYYGNGEFDRLDLDLDVPAGSPQR